MSWVISHAISAVKSETPQAADLLADLVAFIHDKAGQRFEDLELNLTITAIPYDSSGVPKLLRTSGFEQTLSDEQLSSRQRRLPVAPRATADTSPQYREDYNITYISVPQLHAETFSEMIAALITPVLATPTPCVTK